MVRQLLRSLNWGPQAEHKHSGGSDKATDAQKSYSLDGKTAFVTGAAGGIGSAITERLCGLGARVILADRVDRVESAAKEWASKGYKTYALKLDVTDSAAVEKAAADLNKQFGHVDILVANAGRQVVEFGTRASRSRWLRGLSLPLYFRRHQGEAPGHDREECRGADGDRCSRDGDWCRRPQS